MFVVGVIITLILFEQVNGQVSCAQLKQEGDVTDGMKTIRPEEAGGSGVQVECDMTSDPDDGITIIHSTNEARLLATDTSATRTALVHTVNYNGYTMEQIKQLIQKSAECEQHIKIECHHAVMWYSDDREPHTFWVSRDDEKMFMWGGGKTYNRTCGCGITGTCVKTTSGRCNCDANDYRLRTDSGFLTDRERLPVTRIEIADVESSWEYAFYTLGPLRCRGFALPALKSCAEVKAAGFTHTDSYLLDPDGDGGENPYWAYCDFDLYDDDVVTVVFHDVPYHAYVESTSSHSHAFTYRATDNQMINLASDSISCQQYFEYDCYESAFGSSSWISITGETLKNWGGLPDETKACPCSLDGTCDGSIHCNCFSNDAQLRQDKGYIFNKEQLPMKEILVGDVDSTIEYVYFRIGPLECKGSPQKTLSRGTSCYKVETKAVKWQAAADACRRMNAHLVTIDDDSERVYLTKLAKSVVGPLSSMWSNAECTTVESSSTNCDTLMGYICESEIAEYKYFKKAGSDKSPLGSSILTSRKAVSSGVCSLSCERAVNCNSFSYNSKTHDCKLSSESTDSSAVSEDDFILFLLETTYQGCRMHIK